MPQADFQFFVNTSINMESLDGLENPEIELKAYQTAS
jgi:hypothetical protein